MVKVVPSRFEIPEGISQWYSKTVLNWIYMCRMTYLTADDKRVSVFYRVFRTRREAIQFYLLEKELEPDLITISIKRIMWDHGDDVL